MLVTTGDQHYVHKCSVDLIFGILSVINFHESITVYVEDKKLTFVDIKHNYDINKGFKKYTAIMKIGNITFDTIDVITGVITACKWINEDPHEYIHNVRCDHKKVYF